jgi:hypothetical protein
MGGHKVGNGPMTYILKQEEANFTFVQGDRKVAHIKLKVVINCIAVNIIISPTAGWYCRSTNNE